MTFRHDRWQERQGATAWQRPPEPARVLISDELWDALEGLSWMDAAVALCSRGASLEMMAEYHALWEHRMLYGTGDPEKVPVGILSALGSKRRD